MAHLAYLTPRTDNFVTNFLSVIFLKLKNAENNGSHCRNEPLHLWLVENCPLSLEVSVGRKPTHHCSLLIVATSEGCKHSRVLRLGVVDVTQLYWKLLHIATHMRMNIKFLLSQSGRGLIQIGHQWAGRVETLSGDTPVVTEKTGRGCQSKCNRHGKWSNIRQLATHSADVGITCIMSCKGLVSCRSAAAFFSGSEGLTPLLFSCNVVSQETSQPWEGTRKQHTRLVECTWNRKWLNQKWCHGTLVGVATCFEASPPLSPASSLCNELQCCVIGGQT